MSEWCCFLKPHRAPLGWKTRQNQIYVKKLFFFWWKPHSISIYLLSIHLYIRLSNHLYTYHLPIIQKWLTSTGYESGILINAGGIKNTHTLISISRSFLFHDWNRESSHCGNDMIELYLVNARHKGWPSNPKRKAEYEKASEISANEYTVSPNWRVME